MLRGFRLEMQAARSVGRRDYEGAIGRFAELLAENPTNAFARSMLAQCQAGKGDDEAALSAGLEAVEAHPDDYYSLQLIGRIYVMRGQHDRAREYVARSLDHRPKHSPILYRLLLHLTRAIQMVTGGRVRHEEIEGLKDPGWDDREWATWAREYLAWHASQFPEGRHRAGGVLPSKNE